MQKSKNENQFWVEETNDGKVVQLTKKYTLKKGTQYYEVIDFLMDDLNRKNKYPVLPESIGVKFFSSLEFQLGRNNMDEEKCIICMCEFEVKEIEEEIDRKSDEDIYALPCGHYFHLCCLESMVKLNHWAKCPICSRIFGEMIGDMPEGKMTVDFSKTLTCSGYPKGTIVIKYDIPSSVRNGKKIPGTTRCGYLPWNKEGEELLELLKICFERKLTFTIGRSVTTGLDDQVVWNGIHHKTSTSGGAAMFGYPDPTYFERVTSELEAKGITKELIHKNKK